LFAAATRPEDPHYPIQNKRGIFTTLKRGASSSRKAAPYLERREGKSIQG